MVERAKQAGLSKIMITGTSLKSTREAKGLCEKHPGYFYFTSGLIFEVYIILISLQAYIRTMPKNGTKKSREE